MGRLVRWSKSPTADIAFPPVIIQHAVWLNLRVTLRYRDVEDLALVVDGPPEVHPLAGNPDYHLVQVPAIARPRAATA